MRITVSTFGALAGLAGLEHGIGEVLQGNTAPERMIILSWPESEWFAILAGEPAMTLVPSHFMTGILAVLVSLIFLAWAAMFAQRKHGGLVLILLSGLMLIVGGGFGPPILGVIVGIAATGINAPLMWWRMRLSDGLRRFLAKVWPWSYVAGITVWLLVMPGTILLDYFFDVSNLDFVVPILALTVLSAFGLLLVTVFAAFAYDVQQQIGLHKTHSING